MPEAEIPVQTCHERGRVVDAQQYGGIEDPNAPLQRRVVAGEAEGCVEFDYGTDTEDVEDEEFEDPKEGGASSVPRWSGLFKGGFSLRIELVCSHEL